MFTKAFWMDALERAVRTAAQVAIASYAGLQVADVDSWTAFGVAVGGAAALSVLTSLVATQRGEPDTASLVDKRGT